MSENISFQFTPTRQKHEATWQKLKFMPAKKLAAYKQMKDAALNSARHERMPLLKRQNILKIKHPEAYAEFYQSTSVSSTTKRKN